MRKTFVRTNTDSSKRGTKCGEIHYAEGHWYYLCVICGLNAETNDEFRSHLKWQHSEDFVDENIPFTKDKTTPLKAAKLKSVKSKLDDLLHLATVNTDKDIKTILEHTLVESDLAFDVGSKDKDVRNYDSDDLIENSGDGSKDYDYESEDSDVESKDKKNFSCNVPTIEETESNENKETIVLDALDDTDSKIEDLSDNEVQTESTIDWDTPFQPHELQPTYKARSSDLCCTYCGRKFRSRYQLSTHLNIHTGAKPHQCEICGLQFRAFNTLQRHITTHKECSYICRYCNKSFSHRVALMSHELRHTQERKEPCDLCEKRFYTVNHLDTHRRRVHNMNKDVLLPFKCDLCENRYRNRAMLSLHKNRKHYKTAKFQCEKCGKKIVNIQQLEDHKKIHCKYVNVAQNC